MTQNYQKQFDIAHEVLETTDSEGFKTLLSALQEKISQVNTAIGRLNSEMLQQVEKGGVDSDKFVQRVVALEAERKGLQFIINQVAIHRKRKDEAAKHLD